MARPHKIRVGDFYRDCSGHPVLCTEADEWDVAGISLIDGSHPRSCSIAHCAPKRLSKQEALAIRFCKHEFERVDYRGGFIYDICTKCRLSKSVGDDSSNTKMDPARKMETLCKEALRLLNEVFQTTKNPAYDDLRCNFVSVHLNRRTIMEIHEMLQKTS